MDLKEQHVKQAVDYAANQCVEWAFLANSVVWKAYKIWFSKPISCDLVIDLDVLAMNARNSAHLSLLSLLAKEGWQKAHLGEHHYQRQALRRFILGALLFGDSTLEVLRKGIRTLSTEVRIDKEEIKEELATEVLKREVLDGEKADAARKRVARAAGRVLRASRDTAKEVKASSTIVTGEVVRSKSEQQD